MNEEAKPDIILPPIVIHGRAALEDARSRLSSSHKAILLVGRNGRFVVAASIGAANEQALLGAVMSEGEGFLGWAAGTGEPHIRANLRYVPPGAPEPTELEKSLEARSAVAVPFQMIGELRGVMAAYVCHGFNVFVLEDLDALAHVAREWAGRLSEAMLEEDSEQWLRAVLPEPQVEEEAIAAADAPAGAADAGPADVPADYTAQDMDVLLSVFGVDLTTKNPQVAKALKADVGDLMRRDVRDLFSPKPAAPAAEASARPADGPPAAAPAELPTESPDGGEHYSKDDVGRVLSVFGIKVNAPDSALSRALSADVGAILSTDVGDLMKGGPAASGTPSGAPSTSPDDQDREPDSEEGGDTGPPANWP
jgi:hypothetical protein